MAKTQKTQWSKSKKGEINRTDAADLVRGFMLQQPNWIAVSAAAEAAAEKLWPGMPTAGTGAAGAWLSQLLLWVVPHLISVYTADEGRCKLQSIAERIVLWALGKRKR